MRVAQITDLHLRSQLPGSAASPVRRSREMPGLLVRALEDAKRRAADVVVLTGDLVDVPSYVLDGSHQLPATEEDYRLLRELLVASELPFVVLPGNHDLPASLGRVFGFGPYVSDIGQFRLVSFWDREHEGNVPHRVGRERRRFLDALGDPDPRPQVHLQHFVVTPALNEGYPHTYANGEELRRRTVASGRVRLSLSGHYHAGTEAMRDGEVAFATGRAFTEWPHPYRLYDVDATAGLVAMEEVGLGPARVDRPCVFVDWGCCAQPVAPGEGAEALDLRPGAAGALRLLQSAGYPVVVLAAPSAVGSGGAGPGPTDLAVDALAELLAGEAVDLGAVYVSAGAQHRDQAELEAAVFERAARELHLDLTASWFLGARPADATAAQRAGVTAVVVSGGDVGEAARRVRRDNL